MVPVVMMCGCPDVVRTMVDGAGMLAFHCKFTSFPGSTDLRKPESQDKSSLDVRYIETF